MSDTRTPRGANTTRLGSERRRAQRRETQHPHMEAFRALLASQGRIQAAEKFPARIRPFYTWITQQGLDPLQLSTPQAAYFRRWLVEDYRAPGGGRPAPATVKQSLLAVRQWYRYLCAQGQLPRDPVAGAVLQPEPAPKARLPSKQSPSPTPCPAQVTAYLESLVLRDRTPTARSAALALRQYIAWCVQAGIDPLQATRADAKQYLIWLSADYRTPKGQVLARSTAATRIAQIKAWYAYLEAQQTVLLQPFSQQQIVVKRSRVVVQAPLTLQAAQALIETQAQVVNARTMGSLAWAIELRFLAALCLGLASGRRVGGLLALRVDQLDLARQELRVEREKGRRGRVLPVAGWAVSVVQQYVQHARPILTMNAAQGSALFVSSRVGKPLTAGCLNRKLRSLAQQTSARCPDLGDLAQPTLTWHAVRVTFASLLFANDCPIRSVNELMLHRSLNTTALYTPIPVADMQRVWARCHPRY